MKISFIAETGKILFDLADLGLEAGPILVHDATPVFFGAAGDLFGVQQKPVGVAAIHAVNFLQRLQII